MPNLSNRYGGTLSGPDKITLVADDVSTAVQNAPVATLPGPDSAVLNRGISPVTSVPGHGAPAHGGVLPDLNNAVAHTGFHIISASDPYSFPRGYMPEDVLHSYLDKSIVMDGLCILSAHNGAADNRPEFTADMDMLTDIKPKMVFNIAQVAYGGTNGGTELQNMLDKVSAATTQLHNMDGGIICGACTYEEINYWSVDGPPAIRIPYYVFYDLNIHSVERFNVLTPGGIQTVNINIPISYVPGDRTSLSSLTFDGSWMHIYLGDGTYPGYDSETGAVVNAAPSHQSGITDITLVESQLFYYYIATKFIDAGCEALNFSDYSLINKNDINNAVSWKLFSAIRQYAMQYARRGIVLLYAYQDGITNYYYDPTTNIQPNWNRQLLFDFWEVRTPLTRPSAPACTAEYQPQVYNPNTPLGLLGTSPGGINPQGWYCAHNPFIADFDQGDGADVPVTGCAYVYTPQPSYNLAGLDRPCLPSDEFCGYGWDAISWFASQGDINNPANNSFIRNNILLYLYYGAKGYDPYGHFCIPGRQFIRKKWTEPKNTYAYRANTLDSTGLIGTMPGYRQQQTIKDLWNGVYAGPSDWVLHNFTRENVANGGLDVPPASSLIFVGTNKIYFIGQDGYIHGYIWANSTYNGGTWLTVSPSYAANVPAGSQVKAKSDLVACPRGDRLLYIGIDGYIHGFDINPANVWAYNYFDLLKNDMMSQNIKAVSSLIYPTNDSVYYIGASIGLFNTLGKKLIFGFQKSTGAWVTVSPSYSADGSGLSGERIANQLEAAGGLAYEAEYRRLYYRTTSGYLAYFDIRDLITYYYFECGYNSSLQAQHVTVVGNLAINGNRINFVGLYAGSYNIYCVIDNGGTWGGVSPSWSADMYNHQPISTQIQSDPRGEIAVSPDGNTIAYIGKATGVPAHYKYICYYGYIDGVNFSYHQILLPTSLSAYNSLQLINGEDMYFIMPNNQEVFHLKYEEAYLENPNFLLIEDGNPL